MQDFLIARKLRQKSNLSELSLEIRTQLPANELRTGNYNVASSFEGTDQLKMALRLLNERITAGAIPNTVTHSFAIDACGTSGVGVTAVKLEPGMQAVGIKTDVARHNSAISACMKGDQREETRTHAQTIPRRYLSGIQATPTITCTHSPRHTDTPALTLPRQHSPKPQIPSPDSYTHNNATNINVIQLASRKDYSSNPRSTHTQIKLLDRNDHNLAQFCFFVNLNASGDIPYSQLQSGAIKPERG
jgi:hypothetical protein